MLAAFEKYNNAKVTNVTTQTTEPVIIGSMDAVSLYPSIQVDRAEEIVRQSIIESKVNIEGLNVKEMGIHLKKYECCYLKIFFLNHYKTKSKENKIETEVEELWNLFNEDNAPTMDCTKTKTHKKW